jgi:hypothetical protein
MDCKNNLARRVVLSDIKNVYNTTEGKKRKEESMLRKRMVLERKHRIQ